MDINETAREIYKTAEEKGWHEKSNPIPEVLMKMVCELSEAMEEYRDNTPELYTKDGKPEGIAVEMVDCVIRIMDFFVEKEWNLEHILKLKMDYNATREYKHGGKKC